MVQAKDGQESTFNMTKPPHKCEVVKSFFKVNVLNHPPYSPYSFYFQGLRKCFLEISIRLEVLMLALFISVSNRYQTKTIYLLFPTG